MRSKAYSQAMSKNLLRLQSGLAKNGIYFSKTTSLEPVENAGEKRKESNYDQLR
jgi:hypothetical protein